MTTATKPTTMMQDDPLCECGNCGEQYHESELNEIKDYSQRVAPGEEAPAGECPDCGALCHVVFDADEDEGEIHAALRALLEEALNHQRERYETHNHVNGANLNEWFKDWRVRVAEQLKA